jgi:hypothetical protein
MEVGVEKIPVLFPDLLNLRAYKNESGGMESGRYRVGED